MYVTTLQELLLGGLSNRLVDVSESLLRPSLLPAPAAPPHLHPLQELLLGAAPSPMPATSGVMCFLYHISILIHSIEYFICFN